MMMGLIAWILFDLFMIAVNYILLKDELKLGKDRFWVTIFRLFTVMWIVFLGFDIYALFTLL